MPVITSQETVPDTVVTSTVAQPKKLNALVMLLTTTFLKNYDTSAA
ncbi:MAG: hypothetical protein QXL10_02610 [Candidatus Bathyarchaeia archaeon]